MSTILTPLFSNLTGFLLIASPRLADSFFAQSVIYISAHSKKEGTTGVIINKRLSNFKPENVLKKCDSTFLEAMPRHFLGLGGPVGLKQIFIVHTPLYDEPVPSGTAGKNTGPACLSVDLEMVHDLNRQSCPEHAFMVIGHSGWLPGQLETEIFRDYYWLLAPATKKLIFETESTRMWEEALASLNIIPAFLSYERGEG